MQIQEFSDFLTNMVSPLLAGATVSPPSRRQQRTARSLAAFSVGRIELKVRESSAAEMEYTLSRTQEFDDSEKQLVESLVMTYTEAKEAAGSLIEHLVDYILARAIARAVAPNVLPQQETIVKVLSKFSDWSAQTYEGTRVSCGVIVHAMSQGGQDDLTFDEVMGEDFSKALSDGVETWWGIDAAGVFQGFATEVTGIGDALEADAARQTGQQRGDHGLFPFRYRGLATEAHSGRVGITLNRNGEVLLFADGSLKFAKRRGSWVHFAHQATIKQMSNGGRGPKELRQAIYESCIDVSFSRSGACIGLLSRINEEAFLESHMVAATDILGIDGSLKTKVASRLIRNLKFHMVPRLIRKELLGLDGAIVLRADGTFYAAGAILDLGDVERGNQGGRSAAARALGQYGLGVKVSADGLISGYRVGAEHVETAFKVG